MRMKKFVVLGLAFCLATASLTACGQKNGPTQQEVEKKYNDDLANKIQEEEDESIASNSTIGETGIDNATIGDSGSIDYSQLDNAANSKEARENFGKGRQISSTPADDALAETKNEIKDDDFKTETYGNIYMTIFNNYQADADYDKDAVDKEFGVAGLYEEGFFQKNSSNDKVVFLGFKTKQPKELIEKLDKYKTSSSSPFMNDAVISYLYRYGETDKEFACVFFTTLDYSKTTDLTLEDVKYNYELAGYMIYDGTFKSAAEASQSYTEPVEEGTHIVDDSGASYEDITESNDETIPSDGTTEETTEE